MTTNDPLRLPILEPGSLYRDPQGVIHVFRPEDMPGAPQRPKWDATTHPDAPWAPQIENPHPSSYIPTMAQTNAGRRHDPIDYGPGLLVEIDPEPVGFFPPLWIVIAAAVGLIVLALSFTLPGAPR